MAEEKTVAVDATVPTVVVFAADPDRVAAFYRQLAGMAVTHADDVHTVLRLGGFELVVHAIRGAARPDGVGEPVAVREDSYLKVCLPVPSLAEARRVAAALGGGIQAPAREWAARGFRACDGHDPEGNVIQVREPAG